MADPQPISPRARARARRRRRRAVIGLVAIAVVVGGAGTAWAMRGSDGPTYRLTTVTRGTVAQTVDADGTLAASGTRAVSFAAAGTVTGVEVAVGDTVRSGQALATIDPTELRSAVTDANTTLAQAKQKLADDEATQADQATTTASVTSTAASTSTSGGVVTESVAHVRLLSAAAPSTAAAPSAAPSGGTGGGSPTTGADVRRAQAAVVAAQQKLDAAVVAQDKAVDTLVTACASAQDTTPSTYSTTVGANATITGTPGAHPVIVTLKDVNGDVAGSPQQVAAGASYSFTGLTVGATYTVSIVRTDAQTTDSADCTAAVAAVQSDQKDVDTALTSLGTAIANLSAAVDSLRSTGGGGGSSGSPTGGTQPTGGTWPTAGSQPTGGTRPTGGASPSGSTGTNPSGAGRTGTGGTGFTGGTGNTAGGGSGTSGSTARSGTARSGTAGSGTAQSGSAGASVTITAQQIAADAKAIDAAKAELAVAQAAVADATLHTPITGTVAAVAVAEGDTVSANSTSSTITVVGTGTLSVTVDVGLSDIDLVKVGQRARVSVDGHTTALPATVTEVGALNTSSSTGSSSTYPVTVQLTRHYPTLYDGMGAAVAVEVGTAANTLTVPISAVHTIGTLHTVTVYANGTTTPTRVGLGLVGDSSVQVTSGVTAGTRLVLADLGAAVPSSGTNSVRRNSGGALTGLTGAGNAGAPGGFGGGARPGR